MNTDARPNRSWDKIDFNAEDAEDAKAQRNVAGTVRTGRIESPTGDPEPCWGADLPVRQAQGLKLVEGLRPITDRRRSADRQENTL